jgi:hypothetical protein
MNINSSDENSNVPTQGNPVTYTMYLRTPAAIVGDTWRFAFDYIFTEVTGDDRAAALYLQNLTVEAIPEI